MPSLLHYCSNLKPMFTSYRIAPLYPKNCILTISSTPKRCIVLRRNPSTFASKYSTSNLDSQSFTVDYLVKKCGLSPEVALSATKWVHFDNSEKPDSVIALFKSHGFSDAQISEIARKIPSLLTFDPDKTILPKLEFFKSKGASSSDLIKILTAEPRLLGRSIENCLIPFYDSLKRFLLSDKYITDAIKRYPHIVSNWRRASHNVQMLLDKGMPESKVGLLLRQWPRTVNMHPDDFNKVVDGLKELGFNPSRTTFIVALVAKSTGKTTWERKIDLFKRWGWSDETIVSTFRRRPGFMLVSEDKLLEVKDYFVTNLGWDSLVLARYPFLFSVSLEKTIIPRHSVLQVLFSRGLIKDAHSASPFTVEEKVFRMKYVNCFKEEAPELLKLYEEKRNISE